jgi:hypothetical protein
MLMFMFHNSISTRQRSRFCPLIPRDAIFRKLSLEQRALSSCYHHITSHQKFQTTIHAHGPAPYHDHETPRDSTVIVMVCIPVTPPSSTIFFNHRKSTRYTTGYLCTGTLDILGRQRQLQSHVRGGASYTPTPHLVPHNNRTGRAQIYA